MIAAFGYALEGLRAAWRTQRNVRIHVALALAVVVAGIVLRFSWFGWAIIAIAIGLVLATELLNTAVEALVDLVSPQEHPLAKRAKDVAAAGVLAASLAALAAGLCVLIATLRAQ